MSDAVLNTLRDLIQTDVGGRGLRSDPAYNLITTCPGDFAAACRSLAQTPHAKLLIVTGFTIPDAKPPCSETDGPLGALHLARALVPLGVEVQIATDGTCKLALQAGLEMCHLQDAVKLIELPAEAWDEQAYVDWIVTATDRSANPLTHLLALERVGPSHTLKSLQVLPEGAPWLGEFLQSIQGQAAAADEGADRSVLAGLPRNLLPQSRALTAPQWLAWCRMVDQFEQEVAVDKRNRCQTMRGIDITASTSPAHLLFEHAARLEPAVTTIGIGDGGNEIGMGKIPWNIIQRNIPGGGPIACRVPVDFLIVCGVSNWGAYALGAGVRLLRGAAHDAELHDLERERQLLQFMVDFGPLVDGRAGTRSATVDGLTFEQYAEVLTQLGQAVPKDEG